MRKFNSLVLATCFVVALGGCADMTPRQQSTLSGGAIGAGVGAVVGNQSGNPVTGAVIGAGVGAATGYFINRHSGSED